MGQEKKEQTMVSLDAGRRSTSGKNDVAMMS